jgi:hypothetical protein
LTPWLQALAAQPVSSISVPRFCGRQVYCALGGLLTRCACRAGLVASLLLLLPVLGYSRPVCWSGSLNCWLLMSAISNAVLESEPPIRAQRKTHKDTAGQLSVTVSG